MAFLCKAQLKQITGPSKYSDSLETRNTTCMGWFDYFKLHIVDVWVNLVFQATTFIVCSTSLMALLIRSVGGLSTFFMKVCDWLFKALMPFVNLYIHVGFSSNYLIMWCFVLHFLWDFVWVSIQIPEAVDGPMRHDTYTRCRASGSVKQSTIFKSKLWLTKNRFSIDNPFRSVRINHFNIFVNTPVVF